jgi:hypothetical protein
MITKPCCKCGAPEARSPSRFPPGRNVHCQNCKRVPGMGRTSEGSPLKPVYNTWLRMKDRCLNKAHTNYARYGGRGITICKQWLDSFDAFYAYIGPKPSPEHSIGRIDNDGNYEPGNVEWQTTKQQNSNYSRNRFLTYCGVTMTITQWADRLGIHHVSLRDRIRRGLAGEELFRPRVQDEYFNARWITWQGKTQMLKDWAAELGISAHTIRNRLDLKGWTVEKALSTPANAAFQRLGPRTKGLRP